MKLERKIVEYLISIWCALYTYGNCGDIVCAVVIQKSNFLVCELLTIAVVGEWGNLGSFETESKRYPGLWTWKEDCGQVILSVEFLKFFYNSN